MTTVAKPPALRKRNAVSRSPKPRSKAPASHGPSPSQQPYVPHNLTKEWIHGFHRDTVALSLQNLGKSLIHDRQLPNFYFRQTLIAEGVNPDKAARWDPSRWVSPNGKVNISDYNMQLLALTAFLKLNRYLSPEPAGETYMQALKRLKDEMTRLLVDHKMSQAEIAKRLQLNPKTVSCVLRDRHTGRTRICPWEVIRRIKATDWTPTPKTQRRARRYAEPPTPHSLTDAEVSHSRAKDRTARKQATRLRRKHVRDGDPCWKCQASHTHLRPEGQPESRVQELVCRICSASSFKRIGASPKPHDTAARRTA